MPDTALAPTGERLNPFTQADRPRFDEIRDGVRGLQPFLEKLARCGINCEEMQAECDQLKRFADTVEAEFLPRERATNQPAPDPA